ncbi:MAG: heme-binding protein [Pedosphaera sp.]|nr:heme-binding protein [Pedosphaera sp.]
MPKWIVVTVLLSVVVLGFAGCQLSRAGYESAPYTVLSCDRGFELRHYPVLRIAETPSGGDDFMRLFRYISKGNQSETKIAMTTPVFMGGAGAGGRTMSFVLPEKMEEMPEPKNLQVVLRRMEAGEFAVLRFRGKQQESDGVASQALRAWMAERKLASSGAPLFAYFDPPWTPGPLRRNEVMIRLALAR